MYMLGESLKKIPLNCIFSEKSPNHPPQVLLGDNSKEVKTEGDGRAWAVVVPDPAQILPRFVINFR